MIILYALLSSLFLIIAWFSFPITQKEFSKAIRNRNLPLKEKVSPFVHAGFFSSASVLSCLYLVCALALTFLSHNIDIIHTVVVFKNLALLVFALCCLIFIWKKDKTAHFAF